MAVKIHTIIQVLKGHTLETYSEEIIDFWFLIFGTMVFVLVAVKFCHSVIHKFNSHLSNLSLQL